MLNVKRGEFQFLRSSVVCFRFVKASKQASTCVSEGFRPCRCRSTSKYILNRLIAKSVALNKIRLVLAQPAIENGTTTVHAGVEYHYFKSHLSGAMGNSSRTKPKTKEEMQEAKKKGERFFFRSDGENDWRSWHRQARREHRGTP